MPNFKTSSGGTDAAYFHIVREQLQFWPYTIHRIDDTLDAGLIEARAKQLLFRAIHARNLTAFVGSGLSMSYGRLNWRDWEKEQRRTVDQQAKIFKELSESALIWIKYLIRILDRHVSESDDDPLIQKIARTKLWKELHPPIEGVKPRLSQKHKHNVWQWLRGRERAIQAAKQRVARLHATFDLTKEGDGHFPGGEELPVKFEIAQQLHNELRRHVRLFLPSEIDATTDEDGKLSDSCWWPGTIFEPRTDAPVKGLKQFRKVLDTRLDDLGPVKNGYVRARDNFRKWFKRFLLLNQRPEAQLDFEALSKTLLVGAF